MKWLLTEHLGYGWAPGEFIMEVDDGSSNLDPYHETCHIFQSRLNPEYKGPINEGMATYWGGWTRKDVHSLAKENMERLPKKLLLFSTLLGDKRNRGNEGYRNWGHEENGSINKYLIDTYGTSKYPEFYRSLTTDDFAANELNTMTVYGKNCLEIEREWLEFLKKYK